MGVADYIKKNFLGKEIAVSINNSETETILYDDIWSLNREYLQGLVIEVDEGVVVLEIGSWGPIYLNAEDISFFWLPGCNLHAAFRASLTGKLGRAPRE